MKAIRIKDVVKAVNGEFVNEQKDLGELEVTSVSTNSKNIDDGTLFVPIRGERFDGHDFIRDALGNGAVATFTEQVPSIEMQMDGKAYIHVKDAKKALQSLAAYYRALFPIPIIGVTGSVGKTTTKEMLAAALGMKKNVLKTKGNLNSQIGVALMMFELEGEHELAVIEMGVSEKNEMESLAKIVKPESAVITNIGVSHIGNFGSKENIRKEKCHIIDYFPSKGGDLFVCGNDELLRELMVKGDVEQEGLDLAADTLKSLEPSRVILFGTKEGCDYLAENVRYENDQTRFTLKVGNRKEEVELGVLGIHHVHNALAAFALADRYGVDYLDVKRGLKGYKPLSMRGRMMENKGVRIIDDTYNASPDSMKSGLQVLFANTCPGRRFAVLGDVLELGTQSEASHREVGRCIAGMFKEGMRLDGLVTVGGEAKYIAKEVLMAMETEGLIIRTFEGNDKASEYLKGELKQGDLVLVKGSRGMHMDEIVQLLLS